MPRHRRPIVRWVARWAARPVSQRVAAPALALAAALAVGGAPADVAHGRAVADGDPVLRIDTAMHAAMIRRLAVDAPGTRLVTAGDDRTVRVWQLATGPTGAREATLAQVLRLPIGAGPEGQPYALALSPDGTRVAVGGWTCWAAERAGCVYLFDTDSGELVHRVRGLPDAVGALAWSPDGRHLAIGLQGRAGVRVVRTDGFAEAAADPAYADKVMELVWAPDGRLAAVALDGRLRVYRADLRLHARLPVPGGGQPATVRFGAGGTRIAVGFLDAPAVTVVDAATLAVRAARRIDDGAQRSLSSVAWSHDGATLHAAGERDGDGPNRLYRWTDDAAAEPQRIELPARRIAELQAMPAGALAWAAEDPRFGIVEADGRTGLHRAPEVTDFADPAFALRVSADATVIALATPDGRGRTFDAAAETEAAAPPPALTALAPGRRTAPGWRVEPAPDGLAVRVNGRAVPLDDYERVRVHALDADGSSLVLGTEWALRRIDRDGRTLWRADTAAVVRDVVVVAGGAWAVAALSDGTVRWYRLRDGTEHLAYFPHADGEDWIAWTPSGHYRSSLHGDRHVGWLVNRGLDQAPDFHRAVQFERVLYRPDLVRAALPAGARPGVRGLAEAERFDRARLARIAPPRLAVQLLGVTQAADGSPRARIRVTGERGARPLRELSVYVNEIPVTHTDERTLGWLDARRVERELEVPLDAAANRLRVESHTDVSLGVAERLVAIDPRLAARPATGDLHVLAIGADAFPQLPPAAALAYASRDAEAVAAALAAGGPRLFRRVHLQVIADGRDRQADRRTVLEALATTRRARAEDTVVVFLASHGVSDRAGNWWFVPRDAREEDLRAIEAAGPDTPVAAPSLVPWSAFFDALRQTAGRRLLIVDTCQARGIEGRFESFTLLKRSAASRFSLMVAAQSDEESQEYPPGGHGLFTYALLQALAPDPGTAAAADADRDGRITIAEAFDAAAPLVARLHDRALGRQTPALIAPPALAATPLAAARPATPAR